MAGSVLVVEDDFDVRESIVDLLLDHGFEATSAKDGRDGILELKLQGNVGVIILDLSMPMMDGEGFRSEQLAEPALASIPVLVLSADSTCAKRAADMGAAAVLSKPFSPQDLVAEVRRLSAIVADRARSVA